MLDLLNLLWLTALLRPYVFGYFALYCLSGRIELGPRRLALFTLLAWLLAWLSEYSSITTGFPYGFYRYHHLTLGRELWVGGVPFFDSLSYTFLAYASLCAARRRLGAGAPVLKSALLGGVFMLLQDIVVDPVAVRGSRWFLGDLFDYPGGGIYFGVPLSNFGGWLLTGWAICGAYTYLEQTFFPTRPDPSPGLGPCQPVEKAPSCSLFKKAQMLDARNHEEGAVHRSTAALTQDERNAADGSSSTGCYRTGVWLYFIIMTFNIALAFYIGEPKLGAAGLAALAAAAALAWRH
ncbi:MAG: carotenoid biosynthesis protein [Pseudomonadota bacterium]